MYLNVLIVVAIFGIIVYRHKKTSTIVINEKSSIIKYNTFIHDLYQMPYNKRVYKYEIYVKMPSHYDFENLYKYDLMGNYKKKEHVDKMLKDYCENNIINFQRVIINTEGWFATFTIENNIDPRTLELQNYNDSIIESCIDEIYSPLF